MNNIVREESLDRLLSRGSNNYNYISLPEFPPVSKNEDVSKEIKKVSARTLRKSNTFSSNENHHSRIPSLRPSRGALPYVSVNPDRMIQLQTYTNEIYTQSIYLHNLVCKLNNQPYEEIFFLFDKANNIFKNFNQQSLLLSHDKKKSETLHTKKTGYLPIVNDSIIHESQSSENLKKDIKEIFNKIFDLCRLPNEVSKIGVDFESPVLRWNWSNDNITDLKSNLKSLLKIVNDLFGYSFKCEETKSETTLINFTHLFKRDYFVLNLDLSSFFEENLAEKIKLKINRTLQLQLFSKTHIKFNKYFERKLKFSSELAKKLFTNLEVASGISRLSIQYQILEIYRDDLMKVSDKLKYLSEHPHLYQSKRVDFKDKMISNLTEIIEDIAFMPEDSKSKIYKKMSEAIHDRYIDDVLEKIMENLIQEIINDWKKESKYDYNSLNKAHWEGIIKGCSLNKIGDWERALLGGYFRFYDAYDKEISFTLGSSPKLTEALELDQRLKDFEFVFSKHLLQDPNGSALTNIRLIFTNLKPLESSKRINVLNELLHMFEYLEASFNYALANNGDFEEKSLKTFEQLEIKLKEKNPEIFNKIDLKTYLWNFLLIYRTLYQSFILGSMSPFLKAYYATFEEDRTLGSPNMEDNKITRIIYKFLENGLFECHWLKRRNINNDEQCLLNQDINAFLPSFDEALKNSKQMISRSFNYQINKENRNSQQISEVNKRIKRIFHVLKAMDFGDLSLGEIV